MNCSCHMLGGGFFVKFIDSKNAEPFGISEGAKALLEKETAWTVGCHRVCALPQPRCPSHPGVWFSTAPGQAFPWENVIVLADRIQRLPTPYPVLQVISLSSPDHPNLVSFLLSPLQSGAHQFRRETHTRGFSRYSAQCHLPLPEIVAELYRVGSPALLWQPTPSLHRSVRGLRVLSAQTAEGAAAGRVW